MSQQPLSPPPYLATWRPGATTLVIGFAGMQLYQAVPDFEWEHALSALPASAILVRDPAQFWYLRGLGDLAGDVAGGAAALRDLLAGHSFDRLVCLGASTGGYAALLYGALLGAAEVHAFSPMTVLPSRNLLEVASLVRTANWSLIGKHIELRLNRDTGRDYRDLRPILAADNGRTAYHLYFGHGHPADRRNARHLEGLDRVTLHPRDARVHAVVTQMRDSGELDAILAAAVGRAPHAA